VLIVSFRRGWRRVEAVLSDVPVFTRRGATRGRPLTPTE
jgi:hypothetical protein